MFLFKLCQFSYLALPFNVVVAFHFRLRPLWKRLRAKQSISMMTYRDPKAKVYAEVSRSIIMRVSSGLCFVTDMTAWSGELSCEFCAAGVGANDRCSSF